MSKTPAKTWFAAGCAVVLAIGFIADFGGAWDASAKIIEPIERFWGLPIDNTLLTFSLKIILIILVAAIILLIKHRFPEEETAYPPVFDDSRIRASYLQWIRRDIERRLNNSIHKARYFDLKLSEDDTKVTPIPWNFTVRDRLIGEDKTIDSLDHLLRNKPFKVLLLGSPGAGKTTTIFNYLKQFIEKAEKGPANDIPLYVNLNKWKKKGSVIGMLRLPGKKKEVPNTDELLELDFTDWIITMNARLRGAGLTRMVVKKWIIEQKVILFLDGLDEAEESLRKTIVNKINIFLGANPSVSIIVCSRSADYDALVNTTNINLALHSAVTIQPLTPEQTSQYLVAAGTPHLQAFLDNDEELKEMSRSPLDLSIMVLACTYTNFGELMSRQTYSITAKRVALFDAYVKAMIQREQLRKTEDLRHSESQVLHQRLSMPDKKISTVYKYLGWIARTLSENSSSSFSPGKLFEYIPKENNKSPLAYINVTNGVLLLLSLGTLFLLFSTTYSAATLIITPAGLIISYYLVAYGNNSREKTSKTLVCLLIAGWSAIAIATAFVYLPFAYLFSIWGYGLKVLSIILSIIYLLASYELLTLDGADLDWDNLLQAPAKLHLINLLVLLPPLVFLFFFNGIAYPQWVWMYFVVIVVNMYLYQDDDDIFTGRKESAKTILYNIYAVSAGVSGILIFKGEATLITFLFLEVVLTTGLVFFSDDREYDALGLFVGSYLALVASFKTPPLATVGIALISIITLVIFGKRFLEKGMIFFGSIITLLLLKIEVRLPVRFNGFLRYSVRMLLMKKSTLEYEFIHRRVRDYFAIREFVPLLKEASAADRLNTIKEMCLLKDASCDVLLEMIDDHDKDVRMKCINGLGEIGSAIAAKALIEVIKKTSGDLNKSAVAMLHKVKDIAAVPTLVNVLNSYPIESPVFQAALDCIAGQLDQLAAWDNGEKMKECLNHPMRNLHHKIRFALLKMESKDISAIEYISRLFSFEIDSKILEKELDAVLSNMSDIDLEKLLSSPIRLVVKGAYKKLSKKNLQTAVYAFLKGRLEYRNNGETKERRGNWRSSYRAVLTKRDIREITPFLKKIITDNDPIYTEAALLFVYQYGVNRIEQSVLKISDRSETPVKLAILNILSGVATRRSLPFLLRWLHDPEPTVAEAAAKVLYKLNSMKLFDTYINFLQNNRESPVYDIVIDLLADTRSHKAVPFLTGLLDSTDPRTQNAAIYSLSKLRDRQSIPALLNLFNHKNPANLEALIHALGSMEERSILPALPGLFDRYPALHTPILQTLIEFSAEEELEAIYHTIESGKNKRDGELEFFMADYFATCKKFERVARLIYPDDPEKAASLKEEFPQFYDSIDQGTEDLEPDKFLQLLHKTKGQMPHFHPRKEIYERLNISEDKGQILEIIRPFDSHLTQELAISFFKDPNRDMDQQLINKLLTAGFKQEQQLLLLGIIGLFKVRTAIPLLQSYLKKPDNKITYMAIEVLGYMRETGSAEQLIDNLSSHNDRLVKSSLNSLVKMDLSIKELAKLIVDNRVLQTVLVGGDYSNISTQLTPKEYHVLSENDDPVVRYLAAVYSGRAGYGSMINRLSELLKDPTPVPVPTKQDHKTISDGAAFALSWIGTPSAKACLDSWQNKRGLS